MSGVDLDAKRVTQLRWPRVVELWDIRAMGQSQAEAAVGSDGLGLGLVLQAPGCGARTWLLAADGRGIRSELLFLFLAAFEYFPKLNSECDRGLKFFKRASF